MLEIKNLAVTEMVLRGMEVILRIRRFRRSFRGAHGGSAPPPSYIEKNILNKITFFPQCKIFFSRPFTDFEMIKSLRTIIHNTQYNVGL